MRLRVIVPDVTGASSLVALPGGTADEHSSAKAGTGVWVMFEGGDVNCPVWMGLFPPRPSSAPPAPGEPSVAVAVVQVSPPDPSAPVVSPPKGTLWVDES